MGKYNKQAPGDTPGYVYLLHCENGLYKVGRSAWPETRVTELRHAERHSRYAAVEAAMRRHGDN